MTPIEKKNIKSKLKEQLPYGYTTLLYKALNKKFSKSYIGQVCDPSNDRWNFKIIDAATELIVEQNKDRKRFEAKVKYLFGGGTI